MEEINFYDILGLSEDERQLKGDEFDKVLKTKYRKLASQWHPDRFSTKTDEEKKEAEEKFKSISEAYNTLSDSQKRQQYDFSQGGGFDSFGEDFNPWDLFGRHGRQQRTYKGQDIQIEIEVSLEDAYNGNTTTFTYNRMTSCGNCNGTGSADGKSATCPHCNGTGMVSEIRRQGNMQMMSSHPCPHCNGSGKKITNPCPHCHGEGMKHEKTTETVTIPKGVHDGAYTTIKGKGQGLPKDKRGVDGDLFVIFRVAPHKDFNVDNMNNLHKTIDVNIFDALLGCEKKIKCIDGNEVKINIPELTKHGHKFIVKGKGLPQINNASNYRDLIVTINHVLPNKLSNKQKDLLKKINKEG